MKIFSLKKPDHLDAALPLSARRSLPFILLALALLAMAGCAEAVVAGAVVVTKPWPADPPDTAGSIQPHESWCYETLGEPACYAHAQDVDPDRLINVDPPNRYPLTPHAYSNEIHPPPPPPLPPQPAGGDPDFQAAGALAPLPVTNIPGGGEPVGKPVRLAEPVTKN